MHILPEGRKQQMTGEENDYGDATHIQTVSTNKDRERLKERSTHNLRATKRSTATAIPRRARQGLGGIP